MAEREPDPDAPPSDAAPGSEDLRESPEHGHGQFQEAYDAAGDEVAGVGSIAHDDDDEAVEGDAGEDPTT